MNSYCIKRISELVFSYQEMTRLRHGIWSLRLSKGSHWIICRALRLLMPLCPYCSSISAPKRSLLLNQLELHSILNNFFPQNLVFFSSRCLLSNNPKCTSWGWDDANQIYGSCFFTTDLLLSPKISIWLESCTKWETIKL